MITDDEIEKSLSWLVKNATPASQAKANRIYCDEYRKVLKAQLMREHEGLPISAQEREAYADERYIEHLAVLRDAIEKDEQMRWLQTAAEAKIEAWRSFQANQRVQGKVI